MKNLTESQRDAMDTLVPVALFWVVMYFFLSTQPDYCQTNKVQQNVKKQIQSPVLEKYGELITKNK